MTLDEALARLASTTRPVVGTETLPLRAALGRFLAEDVAAAVPVPPADNSAMDGWAFQAAGAEQRLRVVGRAAAGHPFDGVVGPGEAVRILTGALLPDGADSVAMQEHCRVEGDAVVVPAVKAGSHRRRAGEDCAAGSVAVPRGVRLGPQHLAMAAAAGHATLTVWRPLRAAVFSTGDEIREPGQPLPRGCIHDANRTSSIALLERLGCVVTDLGILPDRGEAVRAALAAAAEGHDLILTSGGVSVGEEDHIRPAVESLGSLHFWKLAIKPGKPVALGEVRGRAFIGLPGNPVAGLVTLLMVARPMIRALMGAADSAVARLPAVAGFAVRSAAGRREWLRARVVSANGRLTAELFPHQGAGVLSSMVWADGLVELTEDQVDVAPGDPVAFLPFAELMQ